MKQYEITPLFIVSVPFCAAVLALLFTVFLVFKVKGASSGEPDSKQVKISGIIQRGAMSFLKSEYLWLIPFVIAMAIFFIVEEAIQGDQYDDKPGRTGWRLTICFIIGAILSAASGYAGMLVATECNVKTAEAAKVSLNDALKIAFAGGSVMGFTVVGLSLFGLTLLFWLFAFGWETYDLSDQNNMAKNIATLLSTWLASLLVLPQLHFLRALPVVFTPKLPTWGLTLWVKWKQTFRRILSTTQPPSQTMWVTMWVMLLVWVPTFLSPSWVQWLRQPPLQ
jgi:Na+/H+-translocating membrane pyrophosphatase